MYVYIYIYIYIFIYRPVRPQAGAQGREVGHVPGVPLHVPWGLQRHCSKDTVKGPQARINRYTNLLKPYISRIISK